MMSGFQAEELKGETCHQPSGQDIRTAGLETEDRQHNAMELLRCLYASQAGTLNSLDKLEFQVRTQEHSLLERDT